ncbi:MAG TPA: MopE-related protein [Polyangiales bacterium]|nr:MopE-related protein [Polyangiales bacterium]
MVHAADLVLNGGSMTLSGTHVYRNICLTNNATLNVTAYNGSDKLNTGNLELIAGSIYVEAGSKVVARGVGYQPRLCSDGPGPNATAGGRGGCSVMDSAGGGAHFGRGGRGTVDNPTGTGNVWQNNFPTAFEDDCNIDFVSGACAISNTSRTLCWQGWTNRPTADPATCASPPCVGASVAGAPYWHNIYDREFGAAGGDKGCRDGDGEDPTDAFDAYGNPMGGAGGGRLVLVGLAERNPNSGMTSYPSPCGMAQGRVEIAGRIDAGGKRGCGAGNDSGGGGGGGSVLIVGQNVVVSSGAVVSAAGGLGGDTNAGNLAQPDSADCQGISAQTGGTCDDCGGGGGGGIISVLSVTSSLDPGAQFNVNGALGGVCTICKGEAGGGAGELQLDGAYVGEYCDGYDNDFDGNIDENLGTQSCGLGNCKKTPEDNACTAGVPLSCVPTVNPSDATCKAAPNGARPRVAVILDTSASMLLDLSGYPTFGDGSTEHPGIDTKQSAMLDPDSLPNDSRLQLARESLAQVISAYPEIDFALARYHQDQALNRSCQDAKWFECQGLVGTYDDPTGNTGTLTPTCCAQIGPVADSDPTDTTCNGDTVKVNPTPVPANSQCINYAGSCGAPRRGADILSGFGSKVRDMVRWLDGKESNFSSVTTPGDVCQHSDGVHDCEVRGSGPTPLAGSLLAIEDYVRPIRTTDPAAMCRGYSVILVTDGAESCNGNPVTVATDLHTLGIDVYVVAVSVLASEEASLNAIAAAGSGMPSKQATFVRKPEELVPALTSIIAGAIRTEKCNHSDDDCDGKVDEDFPGLGSTCNDGAKGVCKREGTIDCKDDTSTECKYTGPAGTSSAEKCNLLDDDCDDRIDEGLNCTDTGCVPKGSEVCNAVDDDCDGKVDEADPNLDRECGKTMGICQPGRQRCVAGMLRCVGGVLPGMEVCNGKDDDCDGVIDNDAPCPEGNLCIEGQCRRPCDKDVEFPCPVGYLCKKAPNSEDFFCLPGACALCKSTEICEDEKCKDPCDGVSCDENETCVLGNCKDCTQIGCTNGEFCYEGKCQADACKGVSCSDTEFCFKGECKPFCDEDACGASQRCGTDGTCERDPCAGVKCGGDQVCVGGTCAADNCADMECSFGDVCVRERGCVADPCPVTVCPRGATCSVGDEGQPLCVAPTKPAKPPKRFVGTSGSGFNSCAVSSPGGSGDGAALWLALPALVLTWRRRQRRSRISRIG